MTPIQLQNYETLKEFILPLIEKQKNHLAMLENLGIKLGMMRLHRALHRAAMLHEGGALTNIEVALPDRLKELAIGHTEEMLQTKISANDNAIKHSKWRRKFLIYCYNIDKENMKKYHKKITAHETDVIEECREGNTRICLDNWDDDKFENVGGPTSRTMEASDEFLKAYNWREKLVNEICRNF